MYLLPGCVKNLPEGTKFNVLSQNRKREEFNIR